MATVADGSPEQSGGQTPPAARRSLRPWIWVVVAAATALAIWMYGVFSAPTLVGTWSNRAEDSPITFTFSDDGSGTMTIGSARLSYQYRLDQTRDPAWLDLDAAADGRSVSIRAIAQFARRDKLKIRMPHTRAVDIRPTEFVDNDLENTILLTRVEPGS